MKHAYLIMVHKNNYVLEKLLQLIDYKDNDIYIHVDKKCTDFDYNFYKNIITKSEIYFIKDQINVIWGHYSQIEAELNLMDEAFNNPQEYSYYHLLSGQDMPLVSQEFIHEKLSNENMCFLDYKQANMNNDTNFEFKKIYYRASVFHLFQKYRNRSTLQMINKIIIFVDRIIIGIQIYFLRIDLVKKKKINLRYGSNWFSLPHDAIEYILDNKEKINYYFKYASFCDELFIQTLFSENSMLENRTWDNKRHIDFSRSEVYGHPYVWRKYDFNELVNTESFFARKFDESVDKEIIDLIYEKLGERQDEEIIY